MGPHLAYAFGRIPAYFLNRSGVKLIRITPAGKTKPASVRLATS